MTQLLIPVFYRQFGVRRIQSFLNPTPQTVTTMPRGSMIHFASYDKEHLDVDTSKLYYGPTAKKIVIDFQEELLSTLGSPRHFNAVIKNDFRDFLRQNRKIRYLKNGHVQINDDQTLFVMNYSYLEKLYRYADLPMTSYNHWFNIANTMFKKIDLVCKESHKSHFVFCDVPAEIPSLSLLTVYSNLNNTSMLKIFDTPSKLLVLNLFRWLGGRVATGGTADKESAKVSNGFDSITDANLPHVNLVFTTNDGRSVVLNLGYLNSWIKGQPNTTEFAIIEQITNVQMQKALLKFLLEMRSFIREEVDVPEQVAPSDAADTSEDEELIEAQRDYDNEHDPDTDDVVDNDEYQDALSYANRATTDTKAIANIAPLKIDDKSIDTAFGNDETLDEKLTSLDEDLSELEDIATRSLQAKGIQVSKDGTLQKHINAPDDLPLHEVQKRVYQPEDPETSLRQQLENQVDYGLLTASDYRNFIKDIENFKISKDPYGSGTAYQSAMVVTPESLSLNAEKTRISSSALVQDKSMLQSSLLSFDQDYINNVLRKDMMSMVFGLQKSGIAIRKHEVDIEHSALGSYESHTLEFKPVDGQVSTVRFKVPVIADDGTFIGNSNKYVLRKQRIDVPIRKIKPTEVALTSYYGKTFVKLNPKKSNSSLEWIIKELNIAGMSGQGFIKRVNPARVFDNNFTAPFIYNGLADNFKSIVTERFTLDFDHSERKNLVNEIQLKSLEQDGKRVVGLTTRKEPIVVDKKNVFFVANQNAELTELGDIFEILQLDATRAPVDFSEVNIFSKSVPVAFFLGYNIGFKNLLKLTQAKYRTVEGRQNKNLVPHEYVIQFKDISYIFSRKDKVASMVLAGFNEFDKQLKQYEVEDFNSKNIYLNLLESKGLSAIYIREMDLMQQLFVDPITRDILKQMNEPQTFNGLLMRSTELLQTYHHPDSQDMESMRIRGYERIPGAVYKEMVIAIRAYRNRNIAGKSKVDISPYKVWSSLMEDPSKKMVEDINPIQNLKETEVVTYSGEGGRGKDSMNRASRAYHVNDMGIVSEATVDSSDVGVNAYLSANPRFKDLRGLPSLDKTPIPPSSLISTSALLAPGSDKDDVKRVAMFAPKISNSLM